MAGKASKAGEEIKRGQRKTLVANPKQEAELQQKMQAILLNIISCKKV